MDLQAAGFRLQPQAACYLAYHIVTTETEERVEALGSITRATWTGLVFKGSGD